MEVKKAVIKSENHRLLAFASKSIGKRNCIKAILRQVSEMLIEDARRNECSGIDRL